MAAGPTAAAAPALAAARPGSASLGASLDPLPFSLAVLTFREIWNRSFCRPLEQLVDVITEFPNEVEYIFRPSCVSLQRCGGCCGDEGLHCVPVETSTVTMQVRAAAAGPWLCRGVVGRSETLLNQVMLGVVLTVNAPTLGHGEHEGLSQLHF
uniref:Platelet-derived growth factor (PDGF) family profile domain-containing protein n=1 Tax=Malurus cyaneus samueli TaxID=2593467 RepID=A0A8C5T3V5_9PASS